MSHVVAFPHSAFEAGAASAETVIVCFRPLWRCGIPVPMGNMLRLGMGRRGDERPLPDLA